MVPVSVRARRGGKPAGNQISAVFVDLPVGDPDPVSRLATLSATMLAHKRSGQAVGATALVGLVGLTPPTLHSIAARLTSSRSDEDDPAARTELAMKLKARTRLGEDAERAKRPELPPRTPEEQARYQRAQRYREEQARR